MTMQSCMRIGLPRRKALASSMLVALALGAGFAVAEPTRTATTPFARNHHSGNSPSPGGSAAGWRNRSHAAVRARPAAQRPAATVVVTNCNDSGPGSLRQAMSGAISGDTIDLSALTCSVIKLTSGQLESDGDLVLAGPGRDALAIDGNHASRVLYHTGSLTIRDLTLRNGFHAQGYGGCTWIMGNVLFADSTVTGCRAGDGNNVGAYGAGLDVVGDLTLERSIVSGNEALSTNRSVGGGIYAYNLALSDGSEVSGNSAIASTGRAFGGGAFTTDDASFKYSTIADNRAESTGGVAYGGGLHVNGDSVMIVDSNISGNAAHSEESWSYGGGINVGEYENPLAQVTVNNSTISGNTTSANCADCFIMGGGVSAFGSIDVKYSTISDNEVFIGNYGRAFGGGLSSTHGSGYNFTVLRNSTVSGNAVRLAQKHVNSRAHGGGVAALNGGVSAKNATIAFNTADTDSGGLVTYGTQQNTLISTIVAMNTAPIDGDIGTAFGPMTLDGSHNLIGDVAVTVPLPADTLRSAPKLFPLDNNGGTTKTHALAACSPAIDAGANPGSASTDQRRGTFVRQYGAAPDIGAFEFQPDADRIFRSGFEAGVSCP